MEQQTTIRRAHILWGVLVLCGFLFGARLFYLQVVRHDYYEAQAVIEHQKKFVLHAKRGLIYASSRNGVVPLVMNEPVWLLYADPRYVRDPQHTAEEVAKAIGGNIQEYKSQLSQAKKSYVVLAKKLTKAQADSIKKAELYGIGLTPSERRVYPEGQLGAQIVGFVNDEGIGQYGLEGKLDNRLNGTDGLLHAVTDVRGIPLSISNQNVMKPARDGENLVLTIDRNVQSYAEEALKVGLDKVKATRGSAVVMDPSTGEVVAMANYPTYDPAKYTDVKDYNAFQNSVISLPYEAGSVIKVLTMATGINEKVITKDSTFDNRDQVQVDDATIKNVVKHPGKTSMTDVLQNSLNTGVVHVLSQLGGGKINYQARQKLYQYFTDRFGFGATTGIELAGEAPGYLFSPDEEQGNTVRYANMSFGQGMTVTMLQDAAAFSSAINGGVYYKPHVLKGTYDSETGKVTSTEKITKKIVLNSDTSNQVREMIMTALRNTPALDGADRAGYNIGGKSGTSQIIDKKTGKYIDENAIGTYIGFGGNETPKYVIMVRVEDSKIGAAAYAGSAAAAPIFADISNWLLDYYKIPPLTH